MERILVIGSGPIVVGQGMEFDYAGTQAVLAYQKRGHEVFVLNSNPASIMNDMCQSSIEAISKENVLKIIEKENITALAVSFGGQTGLNLALELEADADFKALDIKILGTDLKQIRKAEDRDLFKKEIEKLGYYSPKSQIVSYENLEAVLKHSNHFPLIIRPAYTLGGYGGGRCDKKDDLKAMLINALNASSIKQALIEEDLSGLIELEFEVISDVSGVARVVLDIENIDPVGVHTGDSMVIAPISSLSDKVIKRLKAQACDIASHFQIIGSCNVQMAYDEKRDKAYVIEMNPRVSRSSALASKISSYPIAEYTAYLSLNENLKDLVHPVEKNRKADDIKRLIYPAFKAPIWPFDLMPKADRDLGTQMKSVGEAMAMSNHLEGAMHQVFQSLPLENYEAIASSVLLKQIEKATDQRLSSLLTLIKRAYDLDELSRLSGIKRYFISKMKQALSFDNDDFYFSSYEQNNKMISMNWKNESQVVSDQETVLFIAPGPSKIGQGIEFDYALMKAILSTQALGYRAVVLNNNPATILTDFNLADGVYFGALTIENIEKIVKQHQKFKGVVLQFGGQTAIDLGQKIHDRGIKIVGTKLASIHKAEDREQFKALLSKAHIKQAVSCIAYDKQDAIIKAKKLHYPLIIRPSFILAGKDMLIVNNETELLEHVTQFKFTHPLLIDEYISGLECDVDVVYDGKTCVYLGALEHIEKSGIHSGDSTLVYPAVNITEKQNKEIEKIVTKLAKALDLKGILNIQLILNEKGIFVIEANPRASRTVPFLYRATGVDVIDLSMRAILDQPFGNITPTHDKVSMKAPIFSFEKLKGVDPLLGPSMKSTGELMISAETFADASAKLYQALGLKQRKNRILYLSERHQVTETLSDYECECIAFENEQDILDIDCVYCEEHVSLTHYQLRRLAVEHKVLLLQTPEQLKLLTYALGKKDHHASL